jgi:hypothetical protein
MKSNRFRLFSVAAAILTICLISPPVAFADSAQLIIHRAPNFGNRQWLQIWIDGNKFEAIAVGHDFTAPLSPGRHVISVLPSDNPWHYPPTKVVLNARAGRTYEFTTVRRGNDRVFLQSTDAKLFPL